MDPISIIRAATVIVNQVKQYSTSIEDAAKVSESFKSRLDLTRKLLTSLETFKEDYSDVLPNSSEETTAGCKWDRSSIQLDEYKDQLKQLRETLEEIATWLGTGEPGSGSRSNTTQHLPAQRRLGKERVGKIMAFSSELETFIPTAHLVMTMALRYENLSNVRTVNTDMFGTV